MTYQNLLGKYLLSGEIVCVTGLHIGGTTTGIEIGGVDNPVIKDPLTEYPYIPGSSLKGKMRALMEWTSGLIAPHPKHNGYSAYACEEIKHERAKAKDVKRWDAAFAVARIFGPASNDTEVRTTAGPTRLIVRDAFPTKDSVEKWREWLGEGIYTEVKTENALDRITSEANPRPIERVPSGSAFKFEMIFDVYDDDDKRLLKHVFSAMQMLEHSSLGGSGSRGHGQIHFQGVKLTWRPLVYYQTGSGEKPVPLPGETVAEILKGFDQIAWPQ
jgi:CRISPR-associated protein Csm3